MHTASNLPLSSNSHTTRRNNHSSSMAHLLLTLQCQINSCTAAIRRSTVILVQHSRSVACSAL